MQYMTSAEIREKYLAFFEKKGCKRMPSASLIPDDPSLLLTSAGMVQFKPYFLHTKEFDPAYIGSTTVQKCVRTNDIDNIGDARHLSFFEMLGNFSFGKYFKEEMCAWAYEFSTEVLGLPKEKLYFTVFEDDDETIEIWKSLGVSESHISRLGEEDNFWRAGPTGPCGPCSEVYFDQGEGVGCGKPDCKPGCDCDRFLEYWNCVFTQFDGQEDGTLAPLATKNIDTGMGLERIAAIMQGVTNNYDTDVLRSLISVGEKLCGKTYGENENVDVSLRIMADHSRSITFMIADGILPSNEGRGYVLRRLLRRAVMKAHLLGVEGEFLNTYVDEVVRLMGSVYPELVENRELTRGVISSEEARFGATLRQGRAFLDEALSALSGNVLPGEQAFVLHDTYGFPVEITCELCQARNVSVDMQEFESCMAEQRERARTANEGDAQAAWSTYGNVYATLLHDMGATKFVGYDTLSAQAKVVAIVEGGKLVQSIGAGSEADVILDTTPFYAEMGGEVGDTGTISCAGVKLQVTDTKAPEKGLVVHKVCVGEGTLKVGTEVSAQVDGMRRACICRNHTATHILHAALRQVLGEHVKQAGSYVDSKRLRFDFTHFQAVSKQELAEVERIANEFIMRAVSTNIYETSLSEAKRAGVTALFGEKYGSTVRVVECGEFSRELCGGCHVSNTSEIGFVKIVSETSVGANVRRIEAVSSFAALEHINSHLDVLQNAASELRCTPLQVAQRTNALQTQLKDAKKAAKQNSTSNSNAQVEKLVSGALETKGGFRVVISEVDVENPGQLRNVWDMIRQQLKGSCAAVLASKAAGKVVLLAAGSEGAVEAGFSGGALIKEIAPLVGGNGGGKPEMAQAGGKNVEGVAHALEIAKEMLCG